MTFDPTLAAVRFGMGLSPRLPAPVSVADMLDRLSGPDVMATRVPIPPFSEAYPSPLYLRDITAAARAARGTSEEEATEEVRSAAREAARMLNATNLRAEVTRAVLSQDSLRERLSLFWADHFTVRSVNGTTGHLVSSHHEEVIRPYVTGRFADMLIAVVGSPLMIVYLDQQRSIGPNSQAARRGNRGLNENMAREMLELHTLGVGGAYTQTDVRQLAELLTGVTATYERGAYFRWQQAEPGAEAVLGVTYGGDEEAIEHVHAALEDLAVHPDTARHLARKLLVHFVGPDPDASLVARMADAYLQQGGALMALYEVMLASDQAWDPALRKVKQPFDFIASSMRALGVSEEVMISASRRDVDQVVRWPLSVMGQRWHKPVGPNGWPEGEEHWITPQGMAGRITWAMHMPTRLLAQLPDPREFVHDALGPNPPEAVLFAAGAAETVSDGIGVVLASAAFQRR